MPGGCIDKVLEKRMNETHPEEERSETPNAVTLQAMADTENGAVVNHASVTEMFADLDAPERGKPVEGK